MIAAARASPATGTKLAATFSGSMAAVSRDTPNRDNDDMTPRGDRAMMSWRRISAIFTGRRAEGREFFQRVADAGGGDFVQHRGQMMESVLLSVLDETVSWKRKGAGP